MRYDRLFPALLIAFVPLAACEPQPEQGAVQDEQPPPATTETAPGVTDEAPAAGPESPDAAGQAAQVVSVENPMPHTMIVYAVEDGERTELGAVDAGETATFTVTAEAGDVRRLVAEDEAQTHEVEQTVTVAGDTTEWTLGG